MLRRYRALPRHEALFTSLAEGEIKVEARGKDMFLAIGGGFMEVTPAGVSILVSRSVHADELNEAEIKKAHELAKDVLKNKGKGAERADAQALLAKFPVYDGVAPTAAGRLYLIDPLGNLVLSYSAAAPDKALLTDVKKLLRLSHIG